MEMISLPDRCSVVKALSEIEFVQFVPGRMVCNLEDVARALGIGSYLVTTDEVAYLIGILEGGVCCNVADPYDGTIFECSKCGETWELTCGNPSDNHLNFCPNCGRQVVNAS